MSLWRVPVLAGWPEPLLCILRSREGAGATPRLRVCPSICLLRAAQFTGTVSLNCSRRSVRTGGSPRRLPSRHRCWFLDAPSLAGPKFSVQLNAVWLRRLGHVFLASLPTEGSPALSGRGPSSSCSTTGSPEPPGTRVVAEQEIVCVRDLTAHPERHTESKAEQGHCASY